MQEKAKEIGSKPRRAGAALKPFAGGIGTGANVRTPYGTRRIELVGPDDLIVTRDNGLQPVRMVWTCTFGMSDIARQPEIAPIRLTPRASGPMMPERAMLIAPDHRFLVPGYKLADAPDNRFCLVKAGEFADISDSAWCDLSVDRVTYIQLVFDHPQVFSVNGLLVESFCPSASAVRGLDRGLRKSLIERYPELRKPALETPVPYDVMRKARYRPDFA